MEDSNRDAIHALTRVTSMWALGRFANRVVIDSACAALIAGVDTPALREVAALPYETVRSDLRDGVERMLHELGEPFVEPDLEAAPLASLAHYCEELLAGRISPRELASWAQSNIGHHGDDAAQQLVDLEDAFEDNEFAPADWRHEAEIRAAAFLALGY